MIEAIYAQEKKKAAREKANAVVEELCSMKLKETTKKVEDGIEETLMDCDFSSEHWTRALMWWAVSRTVTLPQCCPMPAAPCGRHPVVNKKFMK